MWAFIFTHVNHWNFTSPGSRQPKNCPKHAQPGVKLSLKTKKRGNCTLSHVDKKTCWMVYITVKPIILVSGSHRSLRGCEGTYLLLSLLIQLLCRVFAFRCLVVHCHFFTLINSTGALVQSIVQVVQIVGSPTTLTLYRHYKG